MDLDKAISERHSCKRFSTKKVDWRDVLEIVDSARLAPLAGNIPSVKFLIVTEQEKINKLAEASQQSFVSKADYIIVVCSDSDQVKRSYGERGGKYCPQQAGAAIQNLLLKTTELGLATCWVGAFVDDQVRRILDIPDDIEVEGLFPIGYEMPPKSKQRFKPELNNVLYFDIWKNKRMHGLKAPEAV